MTEIQEVSSSVLESLKRSRLATKDQYSERPWGGFFTVADNILDRFLEEYFPGYKERGLVPKRSLLTAKILIIKPRTMISFQMHDRRGELWRVVKGPIGVYRSFTDTQPSNHLVIHEGRTLYIPPLMRHRLVGLRDWGVIAEIWMHTNPDALSDENDIYRLMDDFGRI